MAQTHRKLTILAIVAWLGVAGCTTGGTIPAGSAPAPATPGAASPETGSDPGGAALPPAPSRNAGAVSLQRQAAAELAAGDHERSAATLERAIRIAPRDAALWLDLGEVRMAQGRPDQAEGLARRAAALAGPDDALRRQAEALAQQARGAR